MLLPRTKGGVVIASGIAGFLSVVFASLAFTLEYAMGGAGGASVSTVFGAMVGVHVLIGIGEGIITAATIAVVLAVRPDVVYGASDLEPELELRAGLVTSSGLDDGDGEASHRHGVVRGGRGLRRPPARRIRESVSRVPRRTASTRSPSTRASTGKAKASAVADSPLAGYAVKNVKNEKVSKGLSGIAGVAITLLIAGVVVRRPLVRRPSAHWLEDGSGTVNAHGVGLTVGGRTAPSTVRRRHVADPRARARVQARRPPCFVFAVSWPATRRRSGRSLYAALLVVLAGSPGSRSRCSPKRLAIELPFVASRCSFPSSARPAHRGARDVVVGPGLWGAWNILIKGTWVSPRPGSSWRRPTSEICSRHSTGLPARPRAFTAITGLMIRYVEVITVSCGECAVARIFRVATTSGGSGRHTVAATAGTLFIRSSAAANGCTWRWRFAATAAKSGSGARRRATRWIVALSLPALGALIVVVAAWT